MAVFISPTFAQGAAKPESATTAAASAAVRKMLIAMDYHRVMKASMTQMSQSMPGIMASGAKAAVANDTRLTDAQRKQALKEIDVALPAAFAKLDAIFADPAIIDEMMEAMVPLYAGTFTVQEIEQLAAFHASPVGKKSLAAMPRLMAEGMKIGESVMLPRITAAMSEMNKSVKK